MEEAGVLIFYTPLAIFFFTFQISITLWSSASIQKLSSFCRWFPSGHILLNRGLGNSGWHIRFSVLIFPSLQSYTRMKREEMSYDHPMKNFMAVWILIQDHLVPSPHYTSTSLHTCIQQQLVFIGLYVKHNVLALGNKSWLKGHLGWCRAQQTIQGLPVTCLHLAVLLPIFGHHLRCQKVLSQLCGKYIYQLQMIFKYPSRV